MSSTTQRRLALVAMLAGALAQASAARADSAVPYPEGYREWLHVKSMAILGKEHPLFEAFGGIHHVYANPAAAAALRAGGPFPDGAVLVFDLLAAERAGGAVTEGPRKLVGVMQRDAAASDTGGWRFEGFAGDSRDARLVEDAKTQCFACHAPQAASGYVFSKPRP